MTIEIILLLTIGGALFIALFTILSALLSRRLKLDDRFNVAQEAAETERRSWWEFLQSFLALLKRIGERIPRSPEDLSRQQLRLVRAGFRRKDSAFFFIGTQVTLGGVLIVMFYLSGYLAQNPFLYLVLAVLGGAAIPDLWLGWKIRKRKDELQIGLPDALDLMVVCVEAGLGLDQAIVRIAREIRRVHPALSEELQLYAMEVNAGSSRERALRNLGTRPGVDDLRALTAVLIQASRFGTSIARSLRVFADSMRTKRRQRAEEKAAKMGVKMVPPMVLFIFPGIFVVVIGPPIIGIIRHLLPGLAGG